VIAKVTRGEESVSVKDWKGNAEKGRGHHVVLRAHAGTNPLGETIIQGKGRITGLSRSQLRKSSITTLSPCRKKQLIKHREKRNCYKGDQRTCRKKFKKRERKGGSSGACGEKRETALVRRPRSIQSPLQPGEKLPNPSGPVGGVKEQGMRNVLRGKESTPGGRHSNLRGYNFYGREGKTFNASPAKDEDLKGGEAKNFQKKREVQILGETQKRSGKKWGAA